MAEGFVPPQAVRNNAKRGLELRKKHGRGGTEVGVARARDLSNGAALSLDTIKRMNSYFARHEVDKKGEGWGVDSAGYIAWLLWGGDAGRSWARGITNKEEAKEKSTVKDLTTAYFEIIKSDKRDDGTLMVYGKATDDSLDIDQQICDPLWLDRAMPEWFKSGGNIREQHSSIAAGVAKEYEKKADGHYIHALVVDPISVKKVDNGVLKGFSIGIKSPRVVRDQKAANGRIIDGQIVEVSLVDRPANPNCQLVLAKSVEGESGMWKTEELIEKEQTREANGRFGPSDSSDSDSSGGGEDDMGAQEERGRSDRSVELMGDDLVDTQDEFDESLGQLEQEADEGGPDYVETDIEIIESAQKQVSEAQDLLDDATRPGSFDEHADLIESAATKIETAINTLSDAKSYHGADLQSSLRSVLGGLNDYYDGLDKSVTGDLNKEQTREANGRFGASDSSKDNEFVSQSKVESARSDIKSVREKIESHVDKHERSESVDDETKEELQASKEEVNEQLDAADQALSRAYKTGDGAMHQRLVDKASDHLDEAYRLAEDAPTQFFASNIRDSIDTVRNNLIDYSSSFDGKSASLALQLSEIEDLAEKRAILMKNAQELIELSKSIVPADIVKFDQKLYDDARRALAQLIVVEANEMDAGSNEEMSIAHLLTAVHHLLEWYEGEVAEGEVMDQVTEDIELAAKSEEEAEDKAEKKELKPNKDESKLDFMKRCKEAGMKRMEAKSIYDKYMAEEADMEKSAAHKCLECGCGVPQDAHGRADVSTAQIITPDKTPKSAEPTEEVKELADQELPVEEDKVSEGSDLSEEIEAIVEKAIKSATESLKSEIAELTTANKAAVEKAVGLESELAVTKSLAVAGGPKRTIKPVDHSTNDLMVKAATYKAKADATTDPDLMKGYKLLAEKYFAEADVLNKSN
jgi:hypothetical protein